MREVGGKLTPEVRIPVLHLFPEVNRALLDLLRGFTPEQWHHPTVHKDRDVKDLTAHLLQGSMHRVSSHRDQYHPPTPTFSGFDDIVAFIQQHNRDFMAGMKRVSPEVLIELIEKYDSQVVSLFEALDPDAPGIGVAWAGEMVSRNWFDVAREYTEKWHHQQQLRDATDRPSLYREDVFAPVLETFARGLPYAYRILERQRGTRIAIAATGAAVTGWTLERTTAGWDLYSGVDADAQTRISVDADVVWRVWTRGMRPDLAHPRFHVDGDSAALGPCLHHVAIMA
jgi:hypothetical protein